MEIEFDSAKNEANIAKHGLNLQFGAELFGDPKHLLLSSIRETDGEARMKIIGWVNGKLFTAVFVWRGEAARFISVRRSNNGEERAYRDKI